MANNTSLWILGNTILQNADRTGDITSDVMSGHLAAYVIIMAVSLVGNSLMIHIIFSRPRRLRSSTNSHLANMACADLFVTVVAMPFFAYFICVRLEWLEGLAGDVTCKIATGASIVSVLASTLTLVVMTVDRFVAVFAPLRRIAINRNTKFITMVVWGIAIAFGSPSFYMYTVREEGGTLQCLNNLERTNITLRYAYYLVAFGLMFALPTTVMSIMYSMVAYKLWFREIPGNQTSAGRRAIMRSRKKTLRMLIVIMLAFKACWLPVYVEWFLEIFNSKERRVELAIMLAHANSALNPCLCFLLNSGFRRQLLAIIKRRCCCKDGGESASPSESPSLRRGLSEHLRERYSSSIIVSQRHRHKNYRLAELPKVFTPVTVLHMTNYAGIWKLDEEQRAEEIVPELNCSPPATDG